MLQQPGHPSDPAHMERHCLLHPSQKLIWIKPEELHRLELLRKLCSLLFLQKPERSRVPFPLKLLSQYKFCFPSYPYGLFEFIVGQILNLEREKYQTNCSEHLRKNDIGPGKSGCGEDRFFEVRSRLPEKDRRPSKDEG